MKRFKVLMTIMMVTSIFATSLAVSATEELTTIEVDGYGEYGYREQENQLRITNVLKSEDVGELNLGNGNGWKTPIAKKVIVKAPATVSVIADSIGLFSAYPLTLVNEADQLYTFSYDEEMQPEGTVEYYDHMNDGELVVANIADVWTTLSQYERVYQQGTSYTFAEPGLYYVNARYLAIAGSTDVIVEVVASDEEENVEDKPVEEKHVTESVVTKDAKATEAYVSLMDQLLDLEAYNIDGNNYFKLRDLAYELMGSSKQFEVEWNAEDNAIHLTSGQPYTYVGGEGQKRIIENPVATLTTSTVYKDGEAISLTAYNIDGNNFFKLRDIAKVFDIGISWYEETQSILINPQESYVEE